MSNSRFKTHWRQMQKQSKPLKRTWQRIWSACTGVCCAHPGLLVCVCARDLLCVCVPVCLACVGERHSVSRAFVCACTCMCLPVFPCDRLGWLMLRVSMPRRRRTRTDGLHNRRPNQSSTRLPHSRPWTRMPCSSLTSVSGAHRLTYTRRIPTHTRTHTQKHCTNTQTQTRTLACFHSSQAHMHTFLCC